MGTASAALRATPAEAQVSAASLRGTITDNGEATATSVTIVEIATGYRRTAPVSANGQYNFPSLRPGTYRLEVTTPNGVRNTDRSEEHTSELQSLMRTSYAVFCLKKKKNKTYTNIHLSKHKQQHTKYNASNKPP